MNRSSDGSPAHLRQAEAWKREYARRGIARIESSYTVEPERCVRWFLANWKQGHRPAGRMLDLGCGRGRNAVPCLRAGWQVTGLDQAPAARAAFSRLTRAWQGRARAVTGDLAERLPFAAGTFDAVMEITAADNLTRRALQDRFWREAARVLKPGGWLLTYHFTPADGYYGPLLKRSPRRALGVLFDRQAGMGFRFYTARDVQTASRGRLRVLRTKHYRYRAPMFGQRPVRDLMAAILTSSR